MSRPISRFAVTALALAGMVPRRRTKEDEEAARERDRAEALRILEGLSDVAHEARVMMLFDQDEPTRVILEHLRAGDRLRPDMLWEPRVPETAFLERVAADVGAVVVDGRIRFNVPGPCRRKPRAAPIQISAERVEPTPETKGRRKLTRRQRKAQEARKAHR